MFVNVVGSVNVMITKALPLPVTCQAPAVTAVGCTVVETPLITVPKAKSRSVVIVIPTVTTTASAVTDEVGDCATARPVNPALIASSSDRLQVHLMERRSEPSRERLEP